jgi:4-alpha-glucanotransferase
VGLLDEREAKAAKKERTLDKANLQRQLRLPASHAPRGGEKHFLRQFTGEVHDFLCATPSYLVGLSLDDLTSETDPVNVPGVGPDKYPSWRRRSRMTMEEISWNFEVDEMLRCADRRSAQG